MTKNHQRERMCAQAAAQRYLDFNLGLYADPIFLGDYPASVRKAVPALPHLTSEQKKALKASVDYFALNHYTTTWVEASHHGLQSGFGPSALLPPLLGSKLMRWLIMVSDPLYAEAHMHAMC